MFISLCKSLDAFLEDSHGIVFPEYISQKEVLSANFFFAFTHLILQICHPSQIMNKAFYFETYHFVILNQF